MSSNLPQSSPDQLRQTQAAQDPPFWARMRSNSTDSVRGALYQKRDMPTKSNVLRPFHNPENPARTSSNTGANAEVGQGDGTGRRSRKKSTKSPQSHASPIETRKTSEMAESDDSLNKAESGQVDSTTRYNTTGNGHDEQSEWGKDQNQAASLPSQTWDSADRRAWFQHMRPPNVTALPSTRSMYQEPPEDPTRDSLTRSLSNVVDYSGVFGTGERQSLSSNNRDSSLYGANLLERVDGWIQHTGSSPMKTRNLTPSTRGAPESSPYTWLNAVLVPPPVDITAAASFERHDNQMGDEIQPLVTPAHTIPASNRMMNRNADVDGSSYHGKEFWSGSEYSSSRDHEDDSTYEAPRSCLGRFLAMLNPVLWLTRDMKVNPDGIPYFDRASELSLAGFVRHFFWDPIHPEFTSLQLFCWAILIGAVMGVYTAIWKWFIEYCIEQVWVTVPEKLLQWGLFTDLDGSFPMYHYMWMCPALMGGIISFIQAILPQKIPDQNDWIRNVHTLGVQDHRTFWSLFFISTAGMASGLSLGPELPLVLTAGMAGSWLGISCKQSILQARVMNLTAASAAIGGFFGFPLAGALFVLEIPHRMGLQYFEALSPATVSSIVAVLSNRMMVGNDVTGYYSYPFLTATLPSEIFTSAIVYGFWGAAVGIIYALSCKKVKGFVHSMFHVSEETHQSTPVKLDHGGREKAVLKEHNVNGESTPLMETRDEPRNGQHENSAVASKCKKALCCVVPNEATRSAVTGVIVGATVGTICMFIPHALFWGETQLQTLIDKGRTPLPVFGIGDESTAALVALGRCMIDPKDGAAVMKGFGLHCSFLISVAKIITTGLSLGTGIAGGHFWGPLFVGCSAGHFLSDAVQRFSDATGYGSILARYPCVVILCTMGSTHVVTFRSHMAIMLILTLTISAFDPEDGKNGTVAGDYSAVLPLLVVSVFVSLMISRSTVFYPTQRSRGDIMAVPEVLCEPGTEGRPMVLEYVVESFDDRNLPPQDDYDGEGVDQNPVVNESVSSINSVPPSELDTEFQPTFLAHGSPPTHNSANGQSPLSMTVPLSSSFKSVDVADLPYDAVSDRLSSARLDELLNKPLEKYERTKGSATYPPSSHRRIQSAPNHGDTSSTSDLGAKSLGFGKADGTAGNRERSNSNSSKSLVQVSAYGKVQELQPSLLDQARNRAASATLASCHNRVSSYSKGKHSRKNSESSVGSSSGRPPSSAAAANLVRKAPEPISTSVPYAIRQHVREGTLPATALIPSETSNTATSNISSITGSGALTLDDIDRTFDAKLEALFSQQNP